MKPPQFDEEGLVRSIQMTIGFEHEPLARELLETVRPFIASALSNYKLQLLEDSTQEFRALLLKLLVDGPEKPKTENDDIKAW
jgi:hypothetical protein